MKMFAELLDRLAYTPSRNAKLTLVRDYLRETPDPDRGWALAALTGTLDLPTAKPAMVRDLVTTRVDPYLLGWSHDYVGDFAETVALIWPEKPTEESAPTITRVVAGLRGAKRSETPLMIEAWLDACTAEGRSVVKVRRDSAQLRRTISSSPGSYIVILPALSVSIFDASLSTQATVFPFSARHAPSTSPT